MAIRIEQVGRAVRETEYAVRGPLVTRAEELERAGREIVWCNIGNPQALGQRPLTWVRQVLALAEYPELLDLLPPGAMPADVVAVARDVARQTRHGLGAYTESKGYRFVRGAVADFIHARDGVPSDPEHIYLTDGASKGVQGVLRVLVADTQDGILIPVPQYPLYSATITLLGGAQLPYALEEAAGWRLTRQALEEACAAGRDRGIRPRAVVVINPGNPTGAVLDAENIAMVLEFARDHDLAVLADEVYQENIHEAARPFVSFTRVMAERGPAGVTLFSFHSTSKGILGECGHRGGYFECRNVPDEVMHEVTKLQSISLCANSVGQIVTYLMVRPPRPGDPSFARYQEERHQIQQELRRKAAIIGTGLGALERVHCQPVEGAMYAFPSLELPPGMTDTAYCQALLEEAGICVVPGSGFGQKAGTWHLRTTILPPRAQLEAMVERIASFHREVWRRHGR